MTFNLSSVEKNNIISTVIDNKNIIGIPSFSVTGSSGVTGATSQIVFANSSNSLSSNSNLTYDGTTLTSVSGNIKIPYGFYRATNYTLLPGTNYNVTLIPSFQNRISQTFMTPAELIIEEAGIYKIDCAINFKRKLADANDTIECFIIHNENHSDIFSLRNVTSDYPPLNSVVTQILTGMLSCNIGDIIKLKVSSINDQFNLFVQPGLDYPNIQPVNLTIYKISKT